ncbi:hypothetical protein JL722_12820 [Aureococcus anophagefferens]|nr:hypothetical protein JL722_12820 [Aureococcus anophagefferens]
MDWGASPSSWTCGFSEYTCTPGNGATDLRDCPAIYEDSIVVAPREMRSESEKRFEALMGEGGGDAAVPVAAVEHLEARAPAVVPPDFAAFFCHDFATRGAYDAFVAAGGWAAYPGAVCAAVELDDLWEVDGGFRARGAVVSHYDGRVAAELDSRKLDRVAPAAPPRLALANARPAACDLAAAPGDDDARSPVFERAYALRPVSSSRRRATAPSSLRRRDAGAPRRPRRGPRGRRGRVLAARGRNAALTRLRGWDVRAPALAVADKVGDRPVLTLRLALAPLAAPRGGGRGARARPRSRSCPTRSAPPRRAAARRRLPRAPRRRRRAPRRPRGGRRRRATALGAYGAACLAFAGATCVSHVAVRALPGGARGAADAASLAAFAAAWALGHAAVALARAARRPSPRPSAPRGTRPSSSRPARRRRPSRARLPPVFPV